jgi:molybdenum cofactor biosynthesis enzyme MoaA
MADCRVCDRIRITADGAYCPEQIRFGCVNANRFKPAEPIRLYTITEEAKKQSVQAAVDAANILAKQKGGLL